MVLTVVAAALVDPDGAVLVQRRPPGRAHGDLWEFPGGKVEPGETVEAALARELLEELGIVIDPARASPIGFATAPLDEGQLLLLLYRVTAWPGQPRAIDAAELRWVPPVGLDALAMSPADRALAARLGS